MACLRLYPAQIIAAVCPKKKMSLSVFKPLTIAEEIFKKLVYDNFIAALKVWFIARAPWLNAWPFKPIFNFAIDNISAHFYSFWVSMVDVEMVKLIDPIYQKQYDSASLECRIVLIEKGIESKEFKDAIEKNAKALSKFSYFNA